MYRYPGANPNRLILLAQAMKTAAMPACHGWAGSSAVEGWLELAERRDTHP